MPPPYLQLPRLEATCILREPAALPRPSVFLLCLPILSLHSRTLRPQRPSVLRAVNTANYHFNQLVRLHFHVLINHHHHRPLSTGTSLYVKGWFVGQTTRTYLKGWFVGQTRLMEARNFPHVFSTANFVFGHCDRVFKRSDYHSPSLQTFILPHTSMKESQICRLYIYIINC